MLPGNGFLIGGTVTDIRQALQERIADADRLGAADLLDAWGHEHGRTRLIVDILAPVLHEVGEMWHGKTCSLAHSYVAARIAEDALEKFGKESFGIGEDHKGPVVLGNIEDDCHPLGRKMVGVFLEIEGWRVHDLGVDVEAERFVDEALRVQAKVIGVSAMINTTAENIRRVRREIDERGLTGRLQLAVGGAVFRLRPELVDEVGGDSTTANAIEAPALFEALKQRALRAAGEQP